VKKLILISPILMSCKNPVAPVPPDWGTDCQPSDSEYLELARSTKHRPPPLEPGTTPAQARADAGDWISSLGYEVVIGEPPLYDGLAGGKNFCAVTLAGKIYISKDCAANMGEDDLKWAIILRHEGTHAAQQADIGPGFYPFYFFYAEARLLAYEAPAYEETYDTIRFFGGEVTDEMIRAGASSVYTKYDGTHMPRKCYEEIALELWR